MKLLQDCLHNSAKRHHDKIALRIGEKELSYSALYNQCCVFSSSLSDYGITKGARIAFWLPKCEELYVGILGALEYGAIYIPIDISSPKDRVQYVLDDAECEVLVCRASDYDNSSWEARTLKKVILVDTPEAQLKPNGIETSWLKSINCSANTCTENQNADINPEDIAYILYTSGSTGKPKGVAISHRAAMAFVDWAGEICQLSSADIVANHASLSFDLSVFDIFASIRAGATIVPVPYWPAGGGYPYARFIQDQGISVWYSVPTVLSRITESQKKKQVNLSSLRLVIFAGEPFPKPQLKAFSELVPEAVLYNWYGPTETNVCTYHRVSASDLDTDGPIPIGTACPYSNLKLLSSIDDNVAQLLVGGASLMSGYWKKEGLDQSKLIDGLSKEDGVMYPTGDFVSFKCGTIHYHGRSDSQIKKNGYRIELSEIESCIQASDSVNEAVALYRDPDIIGFVVLNNGNVTEDQLKKLVSNELPPYMAPSTINIIESFPRTDRGKLDKQSLFEMINK